MSEFESFEDLEQFINKLPEPKKEKYEGFRIIEDMALDRETLKEVLSILEDVFIQMKKDERDNSYLFAEGFDKARKAYENLKKQIDDNEFPKQKMNEFKSTERAFVQKVKRAKPVLEFIYKLKQII